MKPKPPILPNSNAKPSYESGVTDTKKNLWIWCRYLHFNTRFISSWTGFNNMLVWWDKTTLKDNIWYLPTIESLVTTKNTIHKILCKALRIKKALGIKLVAVVFDQAIHAKAVFSLGVLPATTLFMLCIFPGTYYRFRMSWTHIQSYISIYRMVGSYPNW